MTLKVCYNDDPCRDATRARRTRSGSDDSSSPVWSRLDPQDWESTGTGRWDLHWHRETVWGPGRSPIALLE